MTLGIDVSKYQATTPSLKGLDFLFARASIGTATDGKYAMHIANARKADLVVGAYHFGDDRLDAARQARVFLAAAGDVDFYFLDVEGRHAMSAMQIRAFYAEVRKAGKQIGLYHSLSSYPGLGQDYNWVAKWSTVPPGIPWHFWQYRGSPLDLDRFNGTRAQLRALAATLPDTSEAPPVGLTITDIVPVSGVVTVSVPDTWIVQVDDPTTRFTVQPGWFQRTLGVGRLVGDPFGADSVPYGDRHTVYLIGGEPGVELAVVLKNQVNLLADKVVSLDDLQAAVNKAVAEAIAADRLKAMIKVVYS